MPCPNCGAAHTCPLQSTQISTTPPSPARGLNGIINIHKPGRMTSHDVVHAVRRAAQISRVGHAGTLDPMATGVLLVCVGTATRVAEYLADHDKTYRARVRLGIETDTYDATGAVVAQHTVSATHEQIQAALASLTGKVTQMPPAYSAIKKDGMPLYKLARRGEHVETAAREIEIYSLILRDLPLPEIEFDVHCSKGTYIRSLAHDLGVKLDCGAHLTALTRTASGQFTLADAIPLEQLCAAFADGRAEQYLNPLDEALLHFQAVIVDPAIAREIQQGKTFTCAREFTTPLLRVYTANGDFIGLLERGDTVNEWKPKKVFLI